MKKTILFIFVSLLTLSCSHSDSASSAYKGNWSGLMAGDIEGTWTGSVSSSGHFSGTVITTLSSPSHDFQIDGVVNEAGDLEGTMKNTTYNINLDMVGHFTATSCNGTWVFDGAGTSGTWEGAKE
jgi:hypothetical protein